VKSLEELPLPGIFAFGPLAMNPTVVRLTGPGGSGRAFVPKAAAALPAQPGRRPDRRGGGAKVGCSCALWPVAWRRNRRRFRRGGARCHDCGRAAPAPRYQRDASPPSRQSDRLGDRRCLRTQETFRSASGVRDLGWRASLVCSTARVGRQQMATYRSMLCLHRGKRLRQRVGSMIGCIRLTTFGQHLDQLA